LEISTSLSLSLAPSCCLQQIQNDVHSEGEPIEDNTMFTLVETHVRPRTVVLKVVSEF